MHFTRQNVLVEVPVALARHHALQECVDVVVGGAAHLRGRGARVRLGRMAGPVDVRLGKHLHGVVRQVEVRGGKRLDDAVGVRLLRHELVCGGHGASGRSH